MPPRSGCRLTVPNKALLHNPQFVIIRPIPAAFTISGGKNFDLRAVDKIGHKVGLTIGANPSSDGRPRRLTAQLVHLPLVQASNTPTYKRNLSDPAEARTCKIRNTWVQSSTRTGN
jgi:hypothetical protein